MKIAALREFLGSSIDIVKYLTADHNANLKEIRNAFGRLSLNDNFESFEVEVTITAGAELAIENKLRGQIPSKRILVRGATSGIEDGATAWTKTHVYLKNTAASSATFTVIFLK